jgi:adenylate kinase family enzyme
MLIGFIGAPCSGKTTTAALVFAALKQMGRIVEFIPELARVYICKKREEEGNKITLDDWDQADIIIQQAIYEDLFVNSGTDFVLTDSSVYNALLYMTPEFRKQPLVSEYMHEISKYDYLFHCPIPQNCSIRRDHCPSVVPHTIINDPNRLHDYSTSLEIEKSIPNIIKHPYITITGDAQTRAEKIIRIILGYSKC